MSRGKRDGAESGVGGTGGATSEGRAVGVFLRALAVRAETDAALAGQIAAALRESGLLPGDVAASDRRTLVEQPRARKFTGARGREEAGEAPDPFVVLRERGEAGLRAALETLELTALRQIVRVHRLDPARISARWTARERVVALIVEQVRARANHGKAFSRI